MSFVFISLAQNQAKVIHILLLALVRVIEMLSLVGFHHFSSFLHSLVVYFS